MTHIEGESPATAQGGVEAVAQDKNLGWRGSLQKGLKQDPNPITRMSPRTRQFARASARARAQLAGEVPHSKSSRFFHTEHSAKHASETLLLSFSV